MEGGAELWDQVTRRRLRLLIVRSSFSANGVSKQQQLFGNSCSSGGVSTRSQLGPWVSFLTADLPPTHPPTRPAAAERSFFTKVFLFLLFVLGWGQCAAPPLMFLLECSKTTVLSEAPVPSVSGNVCGNHISRYECVLCTHSTSWVTTYNLLSATLHHILNNLQGPYDDKAIHARRCFWRPKTRSNCLMNWWVS